MSYFAADEALISFHYQDFGHALKLASDYSTQVAKDAYVSGSDNYKVRFSGTTFTPVADFSRLDQDIVELSARQVLGATVFSGTPENPIL